ncbi:MAG: TetR/AcrR family transcriptional regulator [Prevotella sp.]|nr:TetR/AcrR family transcriptional regulator [Prevotella sp.]
MVKFKNITPTTYRQELKGKILVAAMSLFKREGIKRVKMDDIAQALSISKRTLYEIYENKEQLLCEGVVYEYQLRLEQHRQFTEQAENEIEVVMEVIRQDIVRLGGINPLFFSELAKYERVVELLNKEHEEKRLRSMEFVKKGIENGYFRSDLNYDIISKMSDAVVQHVMMSKMYEEYPLSEIFRNHVDILFRGICTDKGIAALHL